MPPKPHFMGWARCHPTCPWYAFIEAVDYEACWQGLKDELGKFRPNKHNIISLVVLPYGVFPSAHTSKKA